jgi:hypothetical protein
MASVTFEHSASPPPPPPPPPPQDLIDAGLIRPGPNAVTVTYKNQVTSAELLADGTIVYSGARSMGPWQQGGKASRACRGGFGAWPFAVHTE